MNTFYIGMNNTFDPWSNEKVRQGIAQSIDRQRLVDNFYPPGSTVADYFTPCSIPFACEGDKSWDFDAAAGKASFDAGLTELGLDPASFSTTLSYRNAARGYLPDPPAIAQDIASQLETNLGITISLDEQESGTFLDNNAAGTIPGLFLLGWGADFPDASNFMDYHFGSGAGKKFGTPYPDLVAAVQKGGQSAADADRTAAYSHGQQPDPRARTRRRRGPRWLRHRVQGRHRGRPFVAPDQRGLLGHEGRRPGHARVHAERRAQQHLLRRRDRR